MFDGDTGAPFKPSAKKGHKEVEFAATNLHIQRMWLQNDVSHTCKSDKIQNNVSYSCVSHSDIVLTLLILEI